MRLCDRDRKRSGAEDGGSSILWEGRVERGQVEKVGGRDLSEAVDGWESGTADRMGRKVCSRELERASRHLGVVLEGSTGELGSKLYKIWAKVLGVRRTRQDWRRRERGSWAGQPANSPQLGRCVPVAHRAQHTRARPFASPPNQSHSTL